MEQALEGADAVHRVSEFTHYVSEEGCDVLPWPGGKVDGRQLRKRGRDFVTINGVKVHGLGNVDHVVWDCVNGFRKTFPVERVDLSACLSDSRQQLHALRIWNGQSADVPVVERVRRIVAGLTEQGLPLDITLPHPDAARYLNAH